MFACFIFVYDTRNTISTVFTVNTINTFFYLNIYTSSTIKTISAVFTIQTNLTVFTILTCYSNSFRFKIFIKFNVDSCITIIILTDDSLNIFTAVFIISFCTCALNFHSGTKFISFHTARVSVEFQAFINQVISCRFKVRYVYSTVWCIRISTIQLIQECSTSFICNGGPHIVQLHWSC